MIGGFKHAWVARDQATILYICLLRCAQLAGAAHQASCACAAHRRSLGRGAAFKVHPARILFYTFVKNLRYI